MQPHDEQSPVCLQSKGRQFIDLLGKTYVIDILYHLLNQTEAVRFNELKRALGITATTLSRRLDELVMQQGWFIASLRRSPCKGGIRFDPTWAFSRAGVVQHFWLGRTGSVQRSLTLQISVELTHSYVKDDTKREYTLPQKRETCQSEPSI